jgi:N-terminal acetyltransferase B complex non-catalytic subunit
MLSGNEISELLDKISGSFDASSVSVNTLGLTITLFKVQELLGTLFTKSTAGVQGYLCQCGTCFHFCVLS